MAIGYTNCSNTTLLHRSSLSTYPSTKSSHPRLLKPVPGSKRGLAVSTGSGLEEDDHLMAFELFRRAVPCCAAGGSGYRGFIMIIQSHMLVYKDLHNWVILFG
jgi:hypothetical protein